MTNIKNIEAFIGVAQYLSFVSASQKMGISKAMVSRRVADLEAGLQVRLFNRSTRSVTLTDSGRAYLERCTDILQQLDEANAAIRADTVQVQGKLRINAPLSFGNLRLAPLWGAFMLQHPNVELDVVLSDRLVDTVEEGFDLTIRVGELSVSSLVSKQFSSSHLVLCAAPTYLARASSVLVPEDILNHRINVYSGSTQGQQWRFSNALGVHKTIAVSALAGLRCNSGDSCVAASIAGYGLTFQPLFLVEKALVSGELVQLLPDWRTRDLGIHVLYPSRKHLSGKVRAMVDFLVTQFSEKSKQAPRNRPALQQSFQ